MAVGGIDELLRSRELTVNLVRRDLKVRHRGTFLGMLWSLTTPLLLVGLYYFIFTYLFKVKTVPDAFRPDGTVVPFAVYFFAGLVVWNLFASAVGGSTGSVIGSGYLLNKVYFPRAVLPLSTVLSSVVTFAFEMAVLLVATLVFVGPPNSPDPLAAGDRPDRVRPVPSACPSSCRPSPCSCGTWPTSSASSCSSGSGGRRSSTR